MATIQSTSSMKISWYRERELLYLILFTHLTLYEYCSEYDETKKNIVFVFATRQAISVLPTHHRINLESKINRFENIFFPFKCMPIDFCFDFFFSEAKENKIDYNWLALPLLMSKMETIFSRKLFSDAFRNGEWIIIILYFQHACIYQTIKNK